MIDKDPIRKDPRCEEKCYEEPTRECRPEKESEKIYGVIVEFKTQAPTILEGYPVSYEKAYQRYCDLIHREDTVRVAIFRAVIEEGNESLIPK
jgi:hypothetical protein